MSKPIPIILDGDPGHDDAIAWMLAASSPALKILAVTSSSGNQTIEKTTDNALRIMALLGIDAPMAMGAVKPLISPPPPGPRSTGKAGWTGPTCRSGPGSRWTCPPPSSWPRSSPPPPTR